MSLLLASTIDVTVIMTVALVLTMALRRQSAALRHSLLAAALLACAAVPLLEAMVPEWPVALLQRQGPVLDASAVRLGSSAPPEAAAAVSPSPATTAVIDWTRLLAGAWILGVLLSLSALATGLVRLARITSRCTRVQTGRWRAVADEVAREYALRPVAVLQSGERSLLVTCGVIRPKVVLPAGSESWTDARRRIVLTHELAHISRRDWATQMMAEALRAVYWFHPLVWIACRRLRQESEYACDDAVMARGVEATEYATHLLDVARHAVGQRRVWAAAPAIAHPSTLERRIAAMLNHRRNRTPLTRRSASCILGAMLAMAVPVAAMSASAGTPQIAASPGARADVSLTATPVAPEAAAPAPRVEAARPPRVEAVPAAQEKPSSIKGTIYDQLGGLLPGVALTLTDQAVGVAYSATTNRDGTFAFNELQPATYELTAQLPGFASVSSVMPIGADSNVERRILMPIGSLEETITVTCDRSAGPPTPRPRAVLRTRTWPSGGVPQSLTAAVPFSGGIGGQIQAPRQIAKSNPVCPNHVGVDTVVILGGRVGIDGYLSDLRVLRRGEGGAGAQEIVESALEAVRLWQYTPTLLNGVPVEANVTMTLYYNW